MKDLKNYITEKSKYGFAPIDKHILQDFERELNSEFFKCKVGEQEKLWEDGVNGEGPFGEICKKYKMTIGDPTTGDADDGKFRWLFYKDKKVAFIEFNDDYDEANGCSYHIVISNNY